MNLKKTSVNLIPDTSNTSPDYYCTWQTQLYACSNIGPQGQRRTLISATGLFYKLRVCNTNFQ